MNQWTVRAEQGGDETTGRSIGNVRRWIARLFLRSAQVISAEIVDELIVSRKADESSSIDVAPSFRPGGPPHWLARVREGAPELLLASEQGGTPPSAYAGPNLSVPQLFALPTHVKRTQVKPTYDRVAESSPAPSPASAERASHSPYPSAPQPRRPTSPLAPAASYPRHGAEPPPMTPPSFNKTRARVQPPSPVAAETAKAHGDRSLPHGSAPLRRSGKLEAHLPSAPHFTGEPQTQSTHPLVQRVGFPGAPPHDQTRPQNQAWRMPHNPSSLDPVPFTLASPQAKREAPISTQGHGEPTTTAFNSLDGPLSSQSVIHPEPTSERHMAPLRPISLPSFATDYPVKARTTADASSPAAPLWTSAADWWPELPEEQSMDGAASSHALAESDHWRAVSAEQRGGR
jgi:hypothetical protein